MNQWFEQKFNGNGVKRRVIHRRRNSSNLSYTSILIGANVVFFLIATLFGFFNSINCEETACRLIALTPSAVLSLDYLWTFLTSMFMHGGLFHLFANMVSLMFIGNFVEKLIGSKRFLWLYFSGGLFAGILFVLIAALTGMDLNVFAVGASGAIFALGGLLAVLTPRLPVLVFFIIPMPMWAAMAFLMFGLWALSFGLGLPIGNIAHLGGLLVGLGYGFWLKKRYPRKTAMIGRYFSR